MYGCSMLIISQCQYLGALQTNLVGHCGTIRLALLFTLKFVSPYLQVNRNCHKHLYIVKIAYTPRVTLKGTKAIMETGLKKNAFWTF